MWIERAKHNGDDEIKSEMRMKNLHTYLFSVDVALLCVMSELWSNTTARERERVRDMWWEMCSSAAGEILRDHTYSPNHVDSLARSQPQQQTYFQVDK